MKIYYDSPGADNGSNASLNAEWIRIKNTGNSARQLNNWRIRDAQGHIFHIGGVKLGAGLSIKIHTGAGWDSYPAPNDNPGISTGGSGTTSGTTSRTPRS